MPAEPAATVVAGPMTGGGGWRAHWPSPRRKFVRSPDTGGGTNPAVPGAVAVLPSMAVAAHWPSPRRKYVAGSGANVSADLNADLNADAVTAFATADVGVRFAAIANMAIRMMTANAATMCGGLARIIYAQQKRAGRLQVACARRALRCAGLGVVVAPRKQATQGL